MAKESSILALATYRHGWLKPGFNFKHIPDLKDGASYFYKNKTEQSDPELLQLLRPLGRRSRLEAPFRL